MPRTKKDRIMSFSADQAALLFHVISKSNANLNSTQWEEIAQEMGVSNCKAVKERFRRMMAQLKNEDKKGPNTKSMTEPNSKVQSPSPKRKTAAAEVGNSRGAAKKSKVVGAETLSNVEDTSPVKNATATTTDGGHEAAEMALSLGLTHEEYRELRDEIQARDLDGIFTEMEKAAVEEESEEE